MSGQAETGEAGRRVLLTAEWRHLAILNYMVDPELLRPGVPRGTELDFFQGRAYVSLVGFLFLRTKFMGLTIPWHRDFEEVNLRFYVRRQEGGIVKRGVVFLQEIVPKLMVATTARLLYNENYVSLPMKHRIGTADGTGPFAEYSWRKGTAWNRLRVEAGGQPFVPEPDSEACFIAEHYWGYVTRRDGGCLEYEVRHPSWQVWMARQAAFAGDAAPLYGAEMAAVLRRPPDSAVLAEGSPVAVCAGRRIA